MNKKAFLRYLETGDCSSATAEDSASSLFIHDARFHPLGYNGGRCLFRSRQALGDDPMLPSTSPSPRAHLHSHSPVSPSSAGAFDWQETLEPKAWGDPTREIPVVGNGVPVVNDMGRGVKMRAFCHHLVSLAEASIRRQPNYIGESVHHQPQMILDGKVYRFTRGIAAHGLNNRSFFENGNAAAMIGELLNNSVAVPNTPDGLTYRIAAFDIGERYYALITAFRSADYKDIEDVVDVEILHSVNAKRDSASAVPPAAGGTSATAGFTLRRNSRDTDIIANFRSAWQGLFLDGAKKLYEQQRHRQKKPRLTHP